MHQRSYEKISGERFFSFVPAACLRRLRRDLA
jgi:hypothetical protein